MNHKILSKVQEQQEEKIDLIKSIKDLEMELEFMYSREPDEIKYISSLEKSIDELYEKFDKISGVSEIIEILINGIQGLDEMPDIVVQDEWDYYFKVDKD